MFRRLTLPYTFKKDTVNHWLRDAWSLATLPLLLFFAIPLVAMLTSVNPRDMLGNLGRLEVRQAIALSFRTTLISAGLILVGGSPVAYLMARFNFRLKRFIDTLIDLPIVLHPSVAGVALLLAFGRRGLIGSWLDSLGIQVAFTTLAVVLAQVFIAAPFYIRSAALGFAHVDAEIEQAAQLDGASRWQVFQFITAPLSRTAVLSGLMLSWSRALGEFGATIIFAGNLPGRTQTMPTAIYLGFEVDFEIALTLSLILLTFSAVILFLVKLLTVPDEVGG